VDRRAVQAALDEPVVDLAAQVVRQLLERTLSSTYTSQRVSAGATRYQWYRSRRRVSASASQRLGDSMRIAVTVPLLVRQRGLKPMVPPAGLTSVKVSLLPSGS
jgi:hypothetical protein